MSSQRAYSLVAIPLRICIMVPTVFALSPRLKGALQRGSSEGHSPADVGIQGGQPVLVDLEYGEFCEKAYGIGKRLDGVLTQVEVGEVAEAVDLGRYVLQVVLGYVQAVQRR